MLTLGEETTLLNVARKTLEAFVCDGRRLDIDGVDTTPALSRDRASFVTLRYNNGDLRGCIGSTIPASSLLVSVRDNVIRSAARDPRFDPVTEDELFRLNIEISALMDGDEPDSPFTRVSSLEEIVVGRDGLFLEQVGGGAGLLLPQVASEQNWDVEQFLNALCRKSGLGPGAWQASDTVLYRFSAHVFHE